MKYLIIGGCGFLGSNLAIDVLHKGEELIVFDNLSRSGSNLNLQWLRDQGDFQFVYGDIRNRNDVEETIKDIKPDVVFHLAGQVAMTTSIENPRKDFETNVLGTINVLESIRKNCPECIVVYSSTNKVYGDLEWVKFTETDTRYVADEYPDGFDENTLLEFHSPYGCSKGAADQYMLDYARIYGIKTVVFRHSSMYGGRQFSTYDQGWIGWFCSQALLQKQGKLKEPLAISGNGKQVRDVLHADDMKRLYFSAVENIKNAKGEAFNIGGGQRNSLSLLELFALLEQILHVEIGFKQLPPRISDQKVFVADITKAQRILHWSPQINTETGLKKMLNWIESI